MPSLSWYRNGMVLVNGTGGIVISSDMYASYLVVMDSVGLQGGEYNCTGVNVAGDSSIIFIVECKWSIKSSHKLNCSYFISLIFIVECKWSIKSNYTLNYSYFILYNDL